MQILKRAAMTRELIPARKSPIVVNDSAKTGFKSMNMYGWCKQKQYEGTNLFDKFSGYNNIDSEVIKTTSTASDNGYVIESDIEILKAYDPNDASEVKRFFGIIHELPNPSSYSGKTLRIDVDSLKTDIPGETRLVNFIYSTNQDPAIDRQCVFPDIDADNKHLVWTVPADEECSYIVARLCIIESSEKTVPVGKYKVRIEGARLTIGEDMKPWEPYTGGNPSPNPDYPQKIEVAGLNEGVKNLWRNNPLVVSVGTSTVTLAKTLPAGQYTISAVVESNDTDDDYCAMLAYYTDGTTKEIGISRSKNEYERKSTIVTFDKTVNKIRFYASSGHSASTGDTVTFDEIQIEEGSVATDYAPYTGENEIRVEVGGKNWMNDTTSLINNSLYGITYERNGNEFTFSGTRTAGNDNNSRSHLRFAIPELVIGKTYKIISDNSKIYTEFRSSGDDPIFLSTITVTDENKDFLSIYILINDTATSEECTLKEPITAKIYIYDVDDEPQTMTMPTPNGLPGVPIYGDTLAAIYTDTDGQGWWCDEIDFTNGEYVKRVEHAIFDGSEDEIWVTNTAPDGTLRYFVYMDQTEDDELADKRYQIMCNFGSYDNILNQYGLSFIYGNNIYVYPDTEKCPDVDSWRAFLSENPMEVYYPLKNPIRTPLTTEQLAQYAALTAYTPTTTISNSADCYMRVGYLTMEEFVPSDNPSAYPISEIGKYYKALAGFDVELPEPSCRETMLVRKLFDPDYEVNLEIMHDSWTEKYLIDLINETNTCINHNPESDTEKYLAYMLGRRDIQMPVEDCERNFWMARAVGIPIGGAK